MGRTSASPTAAGRAFQALSLAPDLASDLASGLDSVLVPENAGVADPGAAESPDDFLPGADSEATPAGTLAVEESPGGELVLDVFEIVGLLPFESFT